MNPERSAPLQCSPSSGFVPRGRTGHQPAGGVESHFGANPGPSGHRQQQQRVRERAEGPAKAGLDLDGDGQRPSQIVLDLRQRDGLGAPKSCGRLLRSEGFSGGEGDHVGGYRRLPRPRLPVTDPRLAKGDLVPGALGGGGLREIGWQPEPDVEGGETSVGPAILESVGEQPGVGTGEGDPAGRDHGLGGAHVTELIRGHEEVAAPEDRIAAVNAVAPGAERGVQHVARDLRARLGRAKER